MPAKEDPNTLKLRDLEVFQAHEIQNKTLAQTAQEVGVSVDTVKRIKKKPAYRDLSLDALERYNHGIDIHVKALIEKTKAQKCIVMGTTHWYEDDNPTQMKALDAITDIYGIRAPRHIELSGNLTSASDEELFGEIEDAVQSTGLVPKAGKQSDGPADSGDVQGTIL
jgi:hypothetical protein